MAARNFLITVEYVLKRHMGIRSEKDLKQKAFQIVSRAAAETESVRANIRDWLELDEADLGFNFWHSIAVFYHYYH
jgi:hypothetical protein